jgi:hypothetical protein
MASVQARKCLSSNELLLKSVTLRPTGPVSEVKCGNNIGIKIFAANPYVSRETEYDDPWNAANYPANHAPTES